MKRLIIISISVIIGILLAETYLRLFKPQITFDRLPDTGTGCYQPHQELFAVPKPNTVCTLRTPDYTMETPINPQGFVGSEEIPMEKYPDRPRIAFIGDSFTCGQGVYHFMAYPAVIGSMLRGKHIPVEVINASMVGSGPDWYYLQLKNTVAQFRPDIVVIGLFIGNDLSDMDYFYRKATDTAGLPTAIDTTHEYVDIDGVRRSTTTPLRYKIPILRNSHVFQLLVTRLFGSFVYEDNPERSDEPCLLNPDCKKLEKNMSQAVAVLTGIQKISFSINAKLLVVILPWELQLPRHILALSRINFFATDTRRHAITDALARQLQTAGISFIDLLPAFESYTGTEPLLYPQDRHWTPAGHRLAAEAIAPVILSIIAQQP